MKRTNLHMAALLPLLYHMPKLRLVKDDDRPRRGRGAAVSTEVRYRYPAEEIWEVSDDHWQVGDGPHERQQAAGERFTR